MWRPAFVKYATPWIVVISKTFAINFWTFSIRLRQDNFSGGREAVSLMLSMIWFVLFSGMFLLYYTLQLHLIKVRYQYHQPAWESNICLVSLMVSYVYDRDINFHGDTWFIHLKSSCIAVKIITLLHVPKRTLHSIDTEIAQEVCCTLVLSLFLTLTLKTNIGCVAQHWTKIIKSVVRIRILKLCLKNMDRRLTSVYGLLVSQFWLLPEINVYKNCCGEFLKFISEDFCQFQ